VSKLTKYPSQRDVSWHTIVVSIRTRSSVSLSNYMSAFGNPCDSEARAHSNSISPIPCRVNRMVVCVSSGETPGCARTQANICLARDTAHTLLPNIALVSKPPLRNLRKPELSHAIALELAGGWCARGFPFWLSSMEYKFPIPIHGLVLEWRFDHKLLSCRHDADISKTSCTSATVLALHNFHAKAEYRQFLKLMLSDFSANT